MIVLDASAWVSALVDRGTRGDGAREAIGADPELVVPAHCRLEVVRTLTRYEHAGLLTESAAASLVEIALAVQIHEAPNSDAMMRAVWRLRHAISPDDAPYVVIAQLRGIPLVTCDQRLAREAEPQGVEVRLTR